MAPSFARSTYREYASRANFGRRLASDPFSTTGRILEHLTVRNMAEGVGFEPTVQLPVHGISSAAPSATRPPLRNKGNLTVDIPDPGAPEPCEGASRCKVKKKQNLAEGRGFEPPRDLRPYPISSRTPSTGLGHPSAPFTIFSFERTRSGAPRTPRFARRLRPRPGDSAARRPAAGTATAPRPPSDPPRRRRRAPRAH